MTNRELILRGNGPIYGAVLVVGFAVAEGLALLGVDVLFGWGGHPASAEHPTALVVPAVMLLCLVRRGVRVGPASLTPYRGPFALRPIRWDEIDAVHVHQVRSLGPITYYGPVLQLRSGEAVLLDQLVSPTTARRLSRARPVRHVAVIAAYLEHDRPPETE